MRSGPGLRNTSTHDNPAAGDATNRIPTDLLAKQILRVTRIHTIEDKTTVETCYYVTSLTFEDATAAQLAFWIRGGVAVGSRRVA